MMNLAEYRHSNARLADFLPWAALVDEGIILNKDGSFQRTAKFRGPDLDSAVPAELVAVAGRLNNALRRLGSGWAVFVEAQRHSAGAYPPNTFPDVASALVDAERRAQFEEAGAHYESSYFLTFLYLPPEEGAAKAERLLYEGRDRTVGADAREVLRGFIDQTNRVLQLVEGFMPDCAWLDDQATLTYLHSTISTKRHRVRVPEIPMYIDALLADQPLTGGLEPMLGSANVRVLTIVGFPGATTPGVLDDLNRLAFSYRWSTRAIMLDKTDATKLLTKIRRQWFAKRKSIAAILKEVMTNEASVLVDTDASNKAADADLALQELGADYAGRVDRLVLASFAGEFLAGILLYRLRIDGPTRRVSAAEGLALYRITQESLANIAKHAPQAEPVVTLRITRSTAELSIVNRLPVAVSAVRNPEGRGLHGMRQRVELLGGDIDVGPVQGSWHVRASIPLTDNRFGGAPGSGRVPWCNS